MSTRTLQRSSGTGVAITPYFTTLCLWLGTVFVCGLIQPIIGYQAVGFLFLAEVMVVGLVAGTRVVLLSTLLSALAWDYLFIPTRYSLLIDRPEDVSLLLTFFVIAGISAYFTGRSRDVRREVAERDFEARAVEHMVGLLGADATSERRLSRAMDEIEAALEPATAGLLFVREDDLDFEPRPFSSELLKEIDIDGARRFFAAGKGSLVVEDAKRGVTTAYTSIAVTPDAPAVLIVRSRGHLGEEKKRFLKTAASLVGLMAR